MTVQKSKISWTDTTWNPVTGCTKVSAGCDHCYAEAITRRFFGHGFDDIKLHAHRIDAGRRFGPIKEDGQLRPRRVFVNSMSDLFHERIPHSFRDLVFSAMECNATAVFQILTKRPGIAQRYLRHRYVGTVVPRQIWIGVSVESDDVVKRLDVLRSIKDRYQVSCAFVSVEPLIGPIASSRFDDLDWVIVGGESGPRARPMKLSWLQSAIGEARRVGAGVWFKQYGTAANNPIAIDIAHEEKLTHKAALARAVALGLELAPDEKGGATFDGQLLRAMPPAWTNAIDALRLTVSPAKRLGEQRLQLTGRMS